MLVELSGPNLLITLLSWPLFGKALELRYGGPRLLRFLALVAAATGAWLGLLGLFEPLFVRDVEAWGRVPEAATYGFQPVLMACFMACKQAMPDTEVSIFLLFRLKLRTLPAFAMGATALASIFMPSRGAVAMFFAMPISWLYLRYFSTMYSGNADEPGDLRECFSLASFFPPQVQPFVQPLSRWLDSRSCWPSSRRGKSSLPLSGADVDSRVSQSLPAASASARDNRAIATELINERLQSSEKNAKEDQQHDVQFVDTSVSDFEPITPAKKLDFAEN